MRDRRHLLDEDPWRLARNPATASGRRRKCRFQSLSDQELENIILFYRKEIGTAGT